jgi:hypothetical protein
VTVSFAGSMGWPHRGVAGQRAGGDALVTVFGKLFVEGAD